MGFFKNLFSKKEEVPITDFVVPRIKNSNSLTTLKNQGVPDDQLPVTQPLVGDLVVTYAFDLPDSFVMIPVSSYEKMGLTEDQIREIAVRNMQKRISEYKRTGQRPLYSIEVGSDLEACLLLIDVMWEKISENVPGELVAAVPARDKLFFTSSESPEGLTMIKDAAAKAMAAEQVHGLSKDLFAWRGGKWVIFEREKE